MSTEMPVLVVMNPIWLSLFRRGVEDPGWGQRPIEQHAIAVAIHELAATIADEEIRKHIQSNAARMLVNTAQDLVKQSESGDKSTYENSP